MPIEKLWEVGNSEPLEFLRPPDDDTLILDINNPNTSIEIDGVKYIQEPQSGELILHNPQTGEIERLRIGSLTTELSTIANFSKEYKIIAYEIDESFPPNKDIKNPKKSKPTTKKPEQVNWDVFNE